MNAPLFKRDENGLLPEGISYPRKPDGGIDWRKLIKLEHLYPNSDYEEQLTARFNKKLRKLGPDEYAQMSPAEQDQQLLVRLEGWRHLLRLRGYHSLRYRIEKAGSERVSTVCEIEFLGNFETGMERVTHSSTAGASLYCVGGKMQLYLETMAENRAFARCVKSFLGLNIYGADEFDPEMNALHLAKLKAAGKPIPSSPESIVEESSSDSRPDIKPYEKLETRCRELGYTFEQVRASALKVRQQMVDRPESAKECRINDDPAIWTGFSSIQPLDCMTLLAKINEAATKRTGKKA